MAQKKICQLATMNTVKDPGFYGWAFNYVVFCVALRASQFKHAFQGLDGQKDCVVYLLA